VAVARAASPYSDLDRRLARFARRCEVIAAIAAPNRARQTDAGPVRGGGRLRPLSQAGALDIHPPQNHAKGDGDFGDGRPVGQILGPSLGGWLTEK